MIKIGIVGGSIAGCSAAILLLKEGYEVTVFERSNKALVGRGGGIGTSTELIEEIIKIGLVDQDFTSLQINQMPFVGKSNSSEPFGKRAWSLPINFRVFQWNELWRNLRKKVPDNCYKAGTKIMNAIVLNNGKVELIAESGFKDQFDLVLFADGYNSLGRKLLFPESHLKYRGYVLWRGLLPEGELEQTSPLKDEILRLSYAGNQGHTVMYYIPNQEGSVKKGERVFNWAAYVSIPESELDSLMTDQNGRLRKGTLPPGALKPENTSKLKDFIRKNIPAHYAGIIEKTSDSYIQVIYTLDLESYYKDKMCLIGDAGMVIQPFTGSGVFKGYTNVKELISCLKEKGITEDALKRWSQKQLVNGKRLLALGEQMEMAYIREPLDFSVATEEKTAVWWKDSVTFPDKFNYAKN
jgi:2-polyprenyl-6-methoxyphenol hydroxylase-like FAD-dependent oxidoreductase